MPFNNPGLWRNLPRYVANRSAGLRYNPLFLARNIRWALGFLRHATRKDFEETTTALNGLIVSSMREHRDLMRQAGIEARLRETGWMFLYRSTQGFAGSALARETFARFGIATEVLDRAGLSDLEPHLSPIFEKAIWIKDAASVDNPGSVVEAYARLFSGRGGEVIRSEVESLTRMDSGWQVRSTDGSVRTVEHVVVALGPWARAFLGKLGYRVPMVFERGYHMHYRARGNATLMRPVYDTAGAYVLSPMEQGLRLTTGVELTSRDTPRNLAQLRLAERAAREAFPLDSPLDGEPWMGCRPTLPDSRPIIGVAPGQPGLWLAFGHQHIGFSTGPGTAKLLAALMSGEQPTPDAAPFAPDRFLESA
jgi:D-amino-acid dehydrogenase